MFFSLLARILHEVIIPDTSDINNHQISGTEHERQHEYFSFAASTTSIGVRVVRRNKNACKANFYTSNPKYYIISTLQFFKFMVL